MITQDLRLELLSDATISALVGTSRIYDRQPLKDPEATYITLRMTDRNRDSVREQFIMRVLVFSKSLADLATLSDRIIVFLEGKITLNSNHTYYKMSFLSQIEDATRLENGDYFNMLDFIFCKTT